MERVRVMARVEVVMEREEREERGLGGLQAEGGGGSDTQ